MDGRLKRLPAALEDVLSGGGQLVTRPSPLAAN